MTIVIVLLGLAAALVAYQLFLNRDPDKLDRNGEPFYKRKNETK